MPEAIIPPRKTVKINIAPEEFIQYNPDDLDNDRFSKLDAGICYLIEFSLAEEELASTWRRRQESSGQTPGCLILPEDLSPPLGGDRV